jgi:ABC-type maltose transport system permease subunit
MNISEIKKLIISSMDADTDTVEVSGKLEEEGVSYNFSNNFADKVRNRLLSAGLTMNREVNFVKYMNFAFYRIALTGVEGSISFNSFLGLRDNYDESIVCLLTGN